MSNDFSQTIINRCRNDRLLWIKMIFLEIIAIKYSNFPDKLIGKKHYTYTEVTCINGTSIHNNDPNGQSFNKILAKLNGILITVIIKSDNAKFVINKFVDIRICLRLNTT
ncbi:hypothetical protein DERP_003277 [Dermatophagoides pteronyssinus]|uniref:Uncharacterized protein n=1 Tax=Dermatophagoides pteronyssinus TaxID=6956 RepID=A0ABQ8JJ19_DERPT|nr:hypothetical protein DERP_003277 [Dermatophagoides pteronyssinus]